MIKDINKYIADVSGNIYKMFDDHFLKLTPCKPDEKYIVELDINSYHVISYNNACMLINEAYNALPERWNYEGTTYLANILNITTSDDIEEHTIRIRLLPDHSVVVDDNGPSMLKLIRSKGKMYYIMVINEKLPRVKAYDLFGRFVQWLGIKNCKPVWNENENRYM